MPETFFFVRLLNDLLSGIEVNAFRIIGLSATEAADRALKVNQALALELLVVGALILFFALVPR